MTELQLRLETTQSQVLFCFLPAGIQSIPPQGGKLEIAGMVVGQWAGNKPVRGRGGFNMQVVSVGAGRG